MPHRTVNTVFVNVVTGEEVKELPSSFDRDALKPRLVLSTHQAWKDTWQHYKVLQVEEQAGETVVVHVKRIRRYMAPGLVLFLVILGLLALSGVGVYLWLQQ